jgi:hypothetical protein
MVCYFFCDTGVIRGYCDPKDEHHESCTYFFGKYPINLNNYNIAEPVIDELNYYKSKLSKKAHEVIGTAEYTYYRFVENQIDLYIRQIDKFDCNHHGTDRVDELNLLINDLDTVIGSFTRSLENDIEIVANSIIWSCVTGENENHLLTVDFRNLIKNYADIKQTAEYCLQEDFKLLMLYIPEYCEYRCFLKEFG